MITSLYLLTARDTKGRNNMIYKILDEKGHTVFTASTLDQAQDWIRENESLLLFPENYYRIKRRKEAI